MSNPTCAPLTAECQNLDSATLYAMLMAERATVAVLREKLASRDTEIERLELLLAKLERMTFGRSSEKLNRQIEQLELQLEELQSDRGAEDPSDTTKFTLLTAATDQKHSQENKPARRALPTHLRREVQTHLPETQACPHCQGKFRYLGEDVSEVLDYVPGHFKVVRHVRPKFSCAGCSHIAQAAAPSRAINRGMYGPGLLTQLLVAKFAYHMPLYRQAQAHLHEGVELESATMSDAVGGATKLLAPLVQCLHDHVLAPGKLHGDDVPVPVLSPGRGSTKTGRLWVYAKDDRASGNSAPPAVWFAYSPDRKGEHPQHHLRDFTGVLQADAFAGYRVLYQGGKIIEAACMAHARRKFHDLHAVASPTTTEALDRIGQLYVIESAVRGKPPDIRKQERQLRAKPLLVSMHGWLHDTLHKLSAKSETTKAIRYMLDRWEALTNYVDDGRIEIDNNIAERALRAVAIGRKNWLHCGSDAGGERAAAMYSLIGSAKLNGLDPFVYLRHVLTHIADHPINQIKDLLPWNVASVLALDDNRPS